MQIVIPMAGLGERFRRAGYSAPKPLIEIEGRPLIAHVIDMFPGEKDILFVANCDHLGVPGIQMEELIREFCPTARVVGIASHKRGPIHTLLQVEHLLDPQKPIVVNYCDFTCYWDWPHFKEFVSQTKCAGAIPAYRGFHPHSLGNTNYAYMRETGGWVDDIQEKQPYTDNRMEEFASSGTYYFASAGMMFEAFHSAVRRDLNVAGEYYVSLAYKPLLETGQRIAVYPLQHFMQWGTPEDVDEYKRWSRSFSNLLRAPRKDEASLGGLVMPMAGMGKRFRDCGFSLAKPLLPVSGLPMVVQATRDLPASEAQVFVLRSDMRETERLRSILQDCFPYSAVTSIPELTDGQARTALIGVDALEEARGALASPIIIGACDNGTLYDPEKLRSLIEDPSIDVIVWGIRGHPHAARNPHMYGWVSAVGGIVNSISVKSPLEDPANDPIVIGTFIFRTAECYRKAFRQLVAQDDRVNGEFYIDSMINHAIAIGLRCHLFEVDSYLSWGTPDDLHTFEYWQSCFHKWSGHKYRLEYDSRIPQDQVAALEKRYEAWLPKLPAGFSS